MMELVKKRIHRTRRRGSVTSQMTLDDDFNVPDAMDDVAQLILDHGEVRIESVRNLGERVHVAGKLTFRILYRTPEDTVMTLAGGIPFEEYVNLPGLEEEDLVQVTWELDDLNVGIINSRKLNVKALVTLHIFAEMMDDVEVASDVLADGTVETLKKQMEIAVPSVRKKDTFRVKEVLTLPGNRPDVDKLLWQDVKLRNGNTKVLDGKVHLDGELMVFLIYSGEDEKMPIQCLEERVAYSGEVELSEADEEMIPFISVRLLHKDVEINPDADGEMREISLDAVMELDMRLYEEKEAEVLSDLYALDREVIPELGNTCLERVLTRTYLKHRIQEKILIPGGQRLLQICHSDGMVRIDDVEAKEDGLHVDGVLEVKVLSMMADDRTPVTAFTKLLPFHVVMEVPGDQMVADYRLEPGLEQISAVMLGQDTVEVKAVIALDLLAFGSVCEPVVMQVREEPVDMELLKKKPGIVGYVVQSGDSLWKIAREFHTSVDEIMKTNHLSDSVIYPGQKLILVKHVRGRI